MVRLLKTTALLGLLGWASPVEARVKVLTGSGCAKATPGAACRDVSSGGMLLVQHSFAAGKGGATLELDDRTVLRLSEGTEIRLLPRTKVQIGKGDTPAESLQLQRGKILAELGGPGVLLVKGGQQNAAVLKKGSGVIKASEDLFALGVFQGSGVLGSGSSFNEVSEGFIRVFRKGEKPVYRELLRTPSLSSSAALLLRTARAPASLRLSWAPLPGAGSYEVEVRPASGPALLRSPAKGASEMALDDLDVGDHELRLRAIDVDGFESPWSAPVSLSVLSVEMPPGATLSGSTVQLPDKAKIKLRASPGVEASFDRLSTFVPVPGEVGLAQGAAQTLRLRRRGETGELQLLLIPRSYQARVRLSPMNARWPKDPVDIEIELVSSAGLPPGDIELIPRVTLDQEQLSPSWERSGARMQAQIPPRNDGKPHVIRVEVVDQHGFFLGRNFLEVAAEPRR
jgi:hypothetical protein